MGVLIMVGTLVGLIVLIYWLVLCFDPEARAPKPARQGSLSTPIEPVEPVQVDPG